MRTDYEAQKGLRHAERNDRYMQRIYHDILFQTGLLDAKENELQTERVRRVSQIAERDDEARVTVRSVKHCVIF